MSGKVYRSDMPTRWDARHRAADERNTARRREQDPEWAARMDALAAENAREAATLRATTAAWEAAGRPMDPAEYDRLVTLPLREQGYDVPLNDVPETAPFATADEWADAVNADPARAIRETEACEPLLFGVPVAHVADDHVQAANGWVLALVTEAKYLDGGAVALDPEAGADLCESSACDSDVVVPLPRTDQHPGEDAMTSTQPAPADNTVVTLIGDGDDFDAFDDGSRWNGAVCPRFSREVAEEVVRMTQTHPEFRHDEAETLSWDGDAILLESPGQRAADEADGLVYAPTRIEADAHGRYAIGAHAWTWTTATMGEDEEPLVPAAQRGNA